MVRTEVDIALHFHGRAPFNSDGGCSRPGREQHAGISASRDRRSLVGRHPQANKQRLSTADRLCVPKLPPLCARARAAPCWIGGRLTECRLYEEEGAKHNVLCRPHVPWKERSDPRPARCPVCTYALEDAACVRWRTIGALAAIVTAVRSGRSLLVYPCYVRHAGCWRGASLIPPLPAATQLCTRLSQDATVELNMLESARCALCPVV
jgi:hypothetical protein